MQLYTHVALKNCLKPVSSAWKQCLRFALCLSRILHDYHSETERWRWVRVSSCPHNQSTN